MNDPAPHDGGLLRLIQRSVRDRKRICELVLATYRVDLTHTLKRIANSRRPRRVDARHVRTLAVSIAAAADAASLPAVQSDAIDLEERAEIAASSSSKGEQGLMLMAGLKLIDRILDTTKVDASADGTDRAHALN